MPTIRISDESMQRLKAWAEPLVDTADSALAKALDAAERYREARDETEPGPALKAEPGDVRSPDVSAKAFREPLMEVIYERGGSAQGRDLYPALRERMKRYLTPGEFDRMNAGDDGWRKSVKAVRDHLVQEGNLRDDSPRGVWALSDAGLAQVESRLERERGSFVDHLLAFPDVGDDADFDQPRSGQRPLDL